MVCSSTLMARAVIHSANRRNPRRLKQQAKGSSRSCQLDQTSVASVMMRLLCRGLMGLPPPGRFRPGGAAFNRVLMISSVAFGRCASDQTDVELIGETTA